MPSRRSPARRATRTTCSCPACCTRACVSSTVPHARIKSIDTSAAEAYPGVRAVHMLDQPSARSRSCAIRAPRRTSAIPLVRYHGPADRGSRGRRRMRAAKARRSWSRIEYERAAARHVARSSDAGGRACRVPRADRAAATAGGGGAAPGLPQQGNLRGPDTGRSRRRSARRRAARASRRPTYIVDARIPHAGADARADGNARPRRGLARRRADALRLDAVRARACATKPPRCSSCRRSKIRVISEFTGGGFGAKFGIGNYGALAIHLSRKARRAGAADARSPRRARRRRQSAEQPAAPQARREARRHADGDAGRELTAPAASPPARGVGFCHTHDVSAVPNVLDRALRRVHQRRARAPRFARPGRCRGSSRSSRRSTSWPSARHGSARAAREDRHRTTPTMRARARSSAASARRSSAGRSAGRRRGRRPDQARPRHGAIAVGLQSIHGTTACEVRITRRRLGRGVHRRAGHRHRHAHGHGADRRGRARACAPRTSTRTSATRAIRRGPPSGGSRVTELDHAGSAQCRLRRRARSRRRASRRCSSANAEEIVFQDGRVFVRGQPADAACRSPRPSRRPDVDEIVASRRPARRLRRLRAKPATCTSASTASAACSSRRSRSTPRPARVKVRARRRGARLRAADQSEADREPDLRRRDPGRELRAVRGASSRSGAPACSSTPTSISTRSSARARCRRSRCTSSSSSARSLRPMRAASPSRRTSRPRRRSPTRSTTRPASASARCR